MAEDTTANIWVEGEGYSFDDLTFRERKEISRIIRDDLNGNPDDPEDSDFLPAVVTVIKRRNDKAFSVEAALDLKPSDLVKPSRPTRRAASAKK